MWQKSGDYFITMEKYLNSQHSLTYSKLRGKSENTSAETGSKTLTAVETEWKPRAYNNGFPRAQHVKRHNINGAKSHKSDENFLRSFAESPKCTDKVINLHVPRLSIDNCSTDNLDSKRTQSPFVTNNKLYLQKKGVNINSLYSIKQSRRKTSDKTCQYSFDQRVQSDFRTLNNVSDFSRKLLKPDVSQSLHKSQETTKNLRYLRLMKGLDREAKIPGHVRPDDTTGNPLGKVLTKAHLESILAQDQ